MAVYDFAYGLKTLRGERDVAQDAELNTWRSARGALEAVESNVPPEDAEKLKQAVDAKAQEAAQAQSDRNAMILTLVAVIVGIMAHWLWQAAVDVVKTNVVDLGSPAAIVARIVIAVIAGIANFIGIWKQLEKVDPKLRLFFAFTQGFALDAFTSPLTAPTAVAS